MLKQDGRIGKMYYSIGEVSEMFEVNQSLIRYWEKEFDILKPKKNQKGNRQFTRQDIDNLRIIYHLVKERGYTLSGAREKLKHNREDVEKSVEIIDTLRKLKSYLLEIKEEM
jgi:DNA-binding transcriptional MerR regulator